MTDIRKIWLNEKQFSLIKVVFSDENMLAKLDAWQKKYDLKDLDSTTRTILPLLLKKLNSLGLSKKHHPLYKKYYQYHENLWISNLKKISKFNPLVHALTKENIDVCLLKGASMLIYYYKNMGMRPEHSDIDILIRPDDLIKTVAVLKRYGFETFGRASKFIEERLNNSQGFPKTYFHAITFFKDDLFIDIHWRHLKFCPQPSFNLMMDDMIPIQLNHDRVYVLSIEQQLIHICVHGMSERMESNFIWILDALFLMENYGHVLDVQKIKRLAEQYHVATFLVFFINFLKTVHPHAANIFLEKTCAFNPDPKVLTILYRLQLRSHHFIRKISFYVCIYLSVFKKSSLLHKIRSFPDFVRYYFGVSEKEYITLFCLKHFFLHLRKKA